MRIVAMILMFLVVLGGLTTGRYYILYNQSQEMVKFEHSYAMVMKDSAFAYKAEWERMWNEAQMWHNKYAEYSVQYTSLYKNWLAKLDAYDAAKRQIKTLTGKEWIYLKENQ